MPRLDFNEHEISRLRAKVEAAAVASNYPPKVGDLHIGQLVVMRSAGGWYIGRPCIECYKIAANGMVAEWYPQPYSRESAQTFPSKEEATEYLDYHIHNGEWI
jgi:hypothetical protein